mgnify:CR=1 FL=1
MANCFSSASSRTQLVARALGVPPAKADRLIKCSRGDQLPKNTVIARGDGLIPRSVKTPREGRVVAVGGGQVMLETIFRWPGLGSEIVQSINTRDYPMAQALFVMMGGVILVMNFIVDLLYHYLDPRVTYE